MEIEKQAKKLSTSDKEQLIRDMRTWLREEAKPKSTMHPAVDLPDMIGEYADWKLHPDFNWNDMNDAAEKLQTVKSAMTGPSRLDESSLIFVDGSDA
ncbi:MAG: hypothetical protein GY866_11905 [Proteobacteria bacterium]|nr:hypothetical protein [Pseudomonadota bacterium]